MSTKSYEQQTLDKIKKRQLNELNQCPKAFFELISFMQGNLRKQFKSFSLFNLCQGSSHKLRFNDPAFERAFGNMMVRERLEFYERAVAYGIDVFGKDHKTKEEMDHMIDEEIREILPEGYKEIYLTIHEGFRSSEQILVRIQKFKLSSRNHFSINLQNYIFRQSKKKNHPQNYILEAINKSHPERIRFSFFEQEQKADDLGTIKNLADLAFRSTINSMIVPDGLRISPNKAERRPSVRQSIGRLAEPVGTEKEFTLLEEVNPAEHQQILSGKEVLDFSTLLAHQKRESQRSNIRNNSRIVQELLGSEMKTKSGKQLAQSKESQNIFNKVLETQSDIKVLYEQDQSRKQAISPIHRFTSSEVQQYTVPQQKAITKYYKNVLELMLPEFNLRQLQQSVSSKLFQQIYMTTSGSNNFTILQHKDRSQRFQCKLILSTFSITEIYSLLINQQLNKKWNQCIDQSQIKITLSAENCLICYQKHKRYSTWFKQRDYLFMRHAFTYKQCKYIADRSIQHNSFIPFQAIQRGYIRHKITRLREISNAEVEIVVDISVDQGGYLGNEKKKELNLNFLKQYENLQHYLNNNREIIKKISSYCNLDWNIDWIDSNTEGSLPKSLTLKTEDFQQGSQIDQFQADNLDLQSQDFYSIQDIDQQLQQTQPSAITTTDQTTNNFKFQTTQGFQEIQDSKPFAKPSSQNNQKEQLVEEKEISLDEKQAITVEGEKSMISTQIVLDEEGYCILPQKYFRKKHPLLPKENYQEERSPLYQNIVMKGDFVESKDGGILLLNKAKIDAQNNVINFIMKTMRKNLLSGKSILSISLPVEIFKEDSNTQRLCQSMAMGPYFLQKASKTSDPLQRMKLSICFALSNSLMYFYIEKPFNPILGETYQGIIDGCPIYAEQISHHPPITSLYFVGRGFKVHASLQAKVFLHLNSGEGVNQGFYTIEFDDGHVVRFQTAPGELSGFTIGDRKYRFKDKMYVYDKMNCYFSMLNFEDPNAGFFSKSKWDQPDQMEGEILKVTPTFISKLQSSEQKIVPKPKQIQKIESKISGRWIHFLNFDGKEYYNIVKDIPYKLVNYEYALNSDARYREDLIYRMRNDLAKSQIFKENLQNRQRKDRKLRQQYHGKAH